MHLRKCSVKNEKDQNLKSERECTNLYLNVSLVYMNERNSMHTHETMQKARLRVPPMLRNVLTLS